VRTLVIGRSPFADVVIAEESVAPHHAELIVTEQGDLHLTDCGSPSGTWRRAAHDGPRTEGTSGPDGGWVRIRQEFVTADEPLRLGDHGCTAGELLRAAHLVHGSGNDAAVEPAAVWERGEATRPRLRGRVERDAATGEIVRRRP
jgi:hypothetical protein